MYMVFERLDGAFKFYSNKGKVFVKVMYNGEVRPTTVTHKELHDASKYKFVGLRETP